MVWELCSSEVIVMERVDGIPINQIDLLKKSNIDLVQLSHDGVEIFFTQYLEMVFFTLICIQEIYSSAKKELISVNT